jgi:hypothetical protein
MLSLVEFFMQLFSRFFADMKSITSQDFQRKKVNKTNAEHREC